TPISASPLSGIPPVMCLTTGKHGRCNAPAIGFAIFCGDLSARRHSHVPATASGARYRAQAAAAALGEREGVIRGHYSRIRRQLREHASGPAGSHRERAAATAGRARTALLRSAAPVVPGPVARRQPRLQRARDPVLL